MTDVLLVLLVVAATANIIQRAKLARDLRDQEYKTAQLLQNTGKVLAVLIVWAEHWGEDPEAVKPHLLKALK